MSMGVILKPDESGNWGKIGSDPAGSVSEFLTLQNAATALGDGTVVDVGGYAALTLQITITGTATVTFEVSADGTTYNVTSGKVVRTATTSTIATATELMVFTFSGAKFFKARVSAYTSGTITVQGYASQLPYVQIDDMYAAGSVDTNLTSTRMPLVSNYNLLFDGTNWVRQRVAQTADGLANQSNPASTASFLMGFNGSTWDRVKSVNTGQLRTTLYSSTGLEPTVSNSFGSSDGLSTSVNLLGVGQYGFGFAGQSWDRIRVGKVYKYIEYLNLPTSTSTTIWTPTAGRRFRLMMVSVTTSAAIHLHLRDATTIFHTTRTSGDSQIFDFGNGYLSAAANNVLEIRNDSGTTTNVWVTAWGTEE